MKRTIGLFVSSFLIISLNSFSQGSDIPLKTHPDTKGWSDLIKTDLSDAEFPAGVWTCENGVFTASKDECIWTKKEYGNCIIDLEFKNAESTNSGVIVYCTDMKNWIPHSVEIQILDDYGQKWKDAAKTWQCAAIFGHLAPSKQVVKRAGEWNHYTITCKGQMIWVMLNGELVTTMNMALWTSATKNPDGTEIPSWLSTPFAQLATHGRIGLQGKHADATIFFRNMKIKELK
jgi:hypothetical protein